MLIIDQARPFEAIKVSIILYSWRQYASNGYGDGCIVYRYMGHIEMYSYLDEYNAGNVYGRLLLIIIYYK